MTKENVRLDDGFQARCAVCMEPVEQGGTERPFMTFSFGTDPDSAFAFGVFPFCREHLVLANRFDVAKANLQSVLAQIADPAVATLRSR